MTYRGEGDAWLARRGQLARAVSQEEDVTRRQARIHALAAAERERRAETRRLLPVLACAQKASPCDEPFEAMVGDGAVRTCARCDREVFDPARMTVGQIEALARSELRERPDGTMMLADCEEAAHRARVQRVGIVVAAMAVVVTLVAAATSPLHIHGIAPIPDAPRRDPSTHVRLVRDVTDHPPARAMPSFTYFASPDP